MINRSTQKSTHLPGTFRALRHQNYRLWFVGQTISLVGTWMQTMAQQVLVFSLTGTATSLGIVSLMGLIPLVPLSLWGGSISDRFSTRIVLIISQTMMLAQALVLAILTVIAFWQLKDCRFINLDDNIYVHENPYVQSGLNWNSVQYAFSFDFSNWHPVTWLSYMLDHSIFGLNPSGYHLINLLFHVVNTLLLFLVLRRMTKRLWPSAFVACLFAIHPLHVESVAWVAERKDVLSTFFWMLTLLAYGRYARQPGGSRYMWLLIPFVLGLLSKPMLVTLPFVLLLLDYWPLKRMVVLRARPWLAWVEAGSRSQKLGVAGSHHDI